MTESTKRYVLYRNHFNVDVYTLRFNINSPNFSMETMLDTLIRKVMNRFPKARTVVGSISYDMLLVDAKDQNNPSYYLWRANSNQRSASNTEETVLLPKEEDAKPHVAVVLHRPAVQESKAPGKDPGKAARLGEKESEIC